jgi:DNA-binding NarL/FixJ family response regulator
MPHVCACGLCGILSSLAGAKVKQKKLKTYEKIGNFRRNSFRRLLGAEIESDRILSSERKEEVVDARYLVIFLLVGNGFYPAMIAERMHMSQRAVRSAISGFETRLANSAGLRLVCERLSQKWLA